jgi:malonyl-CoA O-methyltransferase
VSFITNGRKRPVSESRDRYAEWAPTYPPDAHNALMEVEQASVLSLLPPVCGRVVLDAGCGTGRYMRLLSALGARVVGVDLSLAMAARARSMQLHVACGDLTAMPVRSDSCDVIVCGLAVIDVPDLSAVLAEWSRVLRRRGVVVYSTLHPIGREANGLAIESIDEPTLASTGHSVAMVVRARRQR